MTNTFSLFFLVLSINQNLLESMYKEQIMVCIMFNVYKLVYIIPYVERIYVYYIYIYG